MEKNNLVVTKTLTQVAFSSRVAYPLIPMYVTLVRLPFLSSLVKCLDPVHTSHDGSVTLIVELAHPRGYNLLEICPPHNDDIKAGLYFKAADCMSARKRKKKSPFDTSRFSVLIQV